MNDKPKFTNQEKHDAARREAGLRKYVYPNRVAAHKMTKQKAEYETAIMEEIAADYERLAAQERLI